MPVNFLLLPPLEELPNNPPSRLIWSIAFFVLTLSGIFAVLMLWPKGESTQTPWFWSCVTVYPMGIAAFVVLRRYSVYEGRRLDAIAWNEAREQHIAKVFDDAAQPLSVLGSAYIFSADEKENALTGLLSGALSLATQRLPKIDTEPMKVRWLAPLQEELKTKPTNDKERQAQLTGWLFDQLLSDMSNTLRTLPSTLRLTVHLDLSGSALPSTTLELWQSRWAAYNLPVKVTVKIGKIKDLMALDQWLDSTNTPASHEAKLMVFVQLNRLLNNAPPEKSAEAGVALLIAPVAMAKQYKLAAIANIHRPMHGKFDAINHVLEYGLKWGKVAATDVVRTWKTGFDIEKSGFLTSCLVKEKYLHRFTISITVLAIQKTSHRGLRLLVL